MSKGVFFKKFFNFIRNFLGNNTEKANYIFYKIIGLTSDIYTLQCINKNVIFYAKITDIVFDMEILYGLHPIQACYIGVEYAKYLQKTDAPTAKFQHKKLYKYSVCRYGSYNLHYQDRKGNICFIKKNTSEEFIMQPSEILPNEDLIQEFDAGQAFYIGLLAGLKQHILPENHHDNFNKVKKPYLHIVQ